MTGPQAQDLIDNTELIAKRLAEIAESLDSLDNTMSEKLDTISESLVRLADDAEGTTTL